MKYYPEYTHVIVDRPAEGVNRITLNRPEKRNALNHPLRGQILQALREGDQDPDVKVQIIRGAGPSFSAGYDLGGGNEGEDMPFYTPAGEVHWIYDVVGIAIVGTILTILIVKSRGVPRARHAFVALLVLYGTLSAGWFTLARTRGWATFARWFVDLPLT